MKPLYVLHINAVVRVPTGTINLAISNRRTFHFATLDERVAVMRCAEANGWEYTTDVNIPIRATDAYNEMKKSMIATCSQFHAPLPVLIPLAVLPIDSEEEQS